MALFLEETYNRQPQKMSDSLIHSYNKKCFSDLATAEETLMNKVLLPGETAFAYYYDAQNIYGQSAIFAVGPLTHGTGNILYKNADQIDNLVTILEETIADVNASINYLEEDLTENLNLHIKTSNSSLSDIYNTLSNNSNNISELIVRSNKLEEIQQLEHTLFKEQFNNLSNDVSIKYNELSDLTLSNKENYDKLIEDVSYRFNNIDNNIININSSLNNIISNINDNTFNNEKNNKELLNKIIDISNNYVTNESLINKVEVPLIVIYGDIKTINSSIGIINSSITNINSSLNNIVSNYVTVKKFEETTEIPLLKLGNDVNILKNNINDINSSLNDIANNIINNSSNNDKSITELNNKIIDISNNYVTDNRFTSNALLPLIKIQQNINTISTDVSNINSSFDNYLTIKDAEEKYVTVQKLIDDEYETSKSILDLKDEITKTNSSISDIKNSLIDSSYVEETIATSFNIIEKQVTDISNNKLNELVEKVNQILEILSRNNIS